MSFKEAKPRKDYVAFPLEKIRGIIPRLDEADIILVHTKRNFMHYLIRRLTKSYWDHVALVLFPKNPKKGKYYNQIIEASFPRGIEIHKLEKYLRNPERYDIGVKRVPNVDPVSRKRIVAFMLMNVDAPYYKASIFNFIFALFSKKLSARLLGQQRFCSSGFVQKAFYEAAEWNQRGKFIFRKDYLSPMELQDLTTPADIASSENTIWIYNKRLL